MLEELPTNNINGQGVSGTDGTDEDPALSEPRIISGASEMEDLDRRLQQVASDPDMHLPQVVNSNSYMHDKVDSGAGSGRQSAGDAVEGIVLKRKASTNFGVPFGMALPDMAKRN